MENYNDDNNKINGIVYIFDEKKHSLIYVLKMALISTVPYIFIRINAKIKGNYNINSLIGDYYCTNDNDYRKHINRLVYSIYPKSLKLLVAQTCNKFDLNLTGLPLQLVDYVLSCKSKSEIEIWFSFTSDIVQLQNENGKYC